MERKKILVLCTGNSCRSQMAEGYLRVFADGRAKIYSAGIETHGVNPLAIAAMKIDGIDISGHTSNHVDEYKEIDFDIVLTVCDHARENCPIIRSDGLVIHHNFKDPSKEIGSEEFVENEFQIVREQIKEYCRKMVSDYLM